MHRKVTLAYNKLKIINDVKKKAYGREHCCLAVMKLTQERAT